MKETKEIENKKKTKKTIIAIVIIFVLIIILVIVLVNNRKINTSETVAQMQPKTETFYMPFLNYEGILTGSQIKSLINHLIAHSNTYQNESEKVFEVSLKQNEEEFNAVYKHECIEEYIEQLNNMYETVIPKTKYEVSLYEGSYSNIHYICITKQGEEKTKKEIQFQLQREMERKLEEIESIVEKQEEIEQIVFILILLNIISLVISIIAFKLGKRT